MNAEPPTDRPVFQAMQRRRSRSKVTDEAPSHDELEELVSVLNSIADHGRLRPWRVIEIRGQDREKLGKALAKANSSPLEKGIKKATRAPLILAIVCSSKPSKKVPYWEQEAVASGVAHALNLLLAEAGWGTMWRTGENTRSKPLRKVHSLEDGEYLLGWIYVGGLPEGVGSKKPRKPLDLQRHLTSL